MFPCVREQCSCAGVFFKDFGGVNCVLRLRVWVENTTPALDATSSAPSSSTDSHCSSSSSSSPSPACLASSVPAEIAAHLAAYFPARRPEVTISYNNTATPSLSEPSAASADGFAFATDCTRLGGGVWEVTFRPRSITGEGLLAQVKAVVGCNAIYTAGFEVRTKASEWVLLQHLPPAVTVADVKAMLTRVSAPAPVSTVVHAACDGTAAAFVRFSSRTHSAAAFHNVKMHVRRTSTPLFPASSAAAAASSCPSADTPTVYASLIVSLTRMFANDERLPGVVVPPYVTLEVLQCQARPSYLPQTPLSLLVKPATAAASVSAAAAPASSSSSAARALPAFVVPTVAAASLKRCVSVDSDDDGACSDGSRKRHQVAAGVASAVAFEDAAVDSSDSDRDANSDAEDDDVVVVVAGAGNAKHCVVLPVTVDLSRYQHVDDEDSDVSSLSMFSFELEGGESPVVAATTVAAAPPAGLSRLMQLDAHGCDFDFDVFDLSPLVGASPSDYDFCIESFEQASD